VSWVFIVELETDKNHGSLFFFFFGRQKIYIINKKHSSTRGTGEIYTSTRHLLCHPPKTKENPTMTPPHKIKIPDPD